MVWVAVGGVLPPPLFELFLFFLTVLVGFGEGVEFSFSCFFSAFSELLGVGVAEPELTGALWLGFATNPSSAEFVCSLGKSAAWAPNAKVEETPARVPPITTAALVDDLRIFHSLEPVLALIRRD